MEPILFKYGKISNDSPAYVIAEAGVNHNGDPDLALKLIAEAKAAGADCVKFQTFKAEEVATLSAPKAAYQLESTDRRQSQFDMLKALELPESIYPSLIEACERHRIDFLSTPYSVGDAAFLDQLGVSAFKVASGQLVEPYFLKELCRFGKPLLVSTGMADLREVEDAVALLKKSSKAPFALFQCSTDYPARLEDANVRVLNQYQRFECWLGFSDHTQTFHAAMASVALGAKVIEKHFTLDRSMNGPDHSCSLDPGELKKFVEDLRKVEAALGTAEKGPTDRERLNRSNMRRSIVATRDLLAGEILKEDSLSYKRPGTGVPPSRYSDFVGKRLKVAVPKDQPLQPDQVEKESP